MKINEGLEGFEDNTSWGNICLKSKEHVGEGKRSNNRRKTQHFSTPRQ